MLTNQSAWFKPTQQQSVLFSVQSEMGVLSIRSLCPETDMDILYGWVNESYAIRFWQMNGSRKVLENTYNMLLRHPWAHPFVIHYNEQLIGQVDLYLIHTDELRDYVNAADNDCGLHLIMQPPRKTTRGLSEAALKTFLSFYFSMPEAGALYAEPDASNEKAILLARKVGFVFLKPIKLSYKSAHLYLIKKDQYPFF